MVDYNSLEPVKDVSQVKIGDIVCLETRTEDSSLPRWNNEYDCGGSGKWVEAEIKDIYENKKEFLVALPDEYTWWFTFRLYCDSGGRNKDGWPRLQIVQKEEASSSICTCSTYVVCNLGCPSNRGLKCPDRQDV